MEQQLAAMLADFRRTTSRQLQQLEQGIDELSARINLDGQLCAEAALEALAAAGVLHGTAAGTKSPARRQPQETDDAASPNSPLPADQNNCCRSGAGTSDAGTDRQQRPS